MERPQGEKEGFLDKKVRRRDVLGFILGGAAATMPGSTPRNGPSQSDTAPIAGEPHLDPNGSPDDQEFNGRMRAWEDFLRIFIHKEGEKYEKALQSVDEQITMDADRTLTITLVPRGEEDAEALGTVYFPPDDNPERLLTCYEVLKEILAKRYSQITSIDI